MGKRVALRRLLKKEASRKGKIIAHIKKDFDPAEKEIGLILCLVFIVTFM